LPPPLVGATTKRISEPAFTKGHVGRLEQPNAVFRETMEVHLHGITRAPVGRRENLN